MILSKRNLKFGRGFRQSVMCRLRASTHIRSGLVPNAISRRAPAQTGWQAFVVDDFKQALRMDLALILLPLRTPAGDVRSVAFAGEHGFFEA